MTVSHPGAAGLTPGVAPTDIRPAGDHAILVELPTLDAVLSLQAQLTAHPQPGQVDVIAAARTVLITAASPEAVKALAAHICTLDLAAPADTESTLVTIDVVYDGEDLDEVATLTGLGREGVVTAHTGQLWTAAFAGFAPGFAYLTADNNALEVPRRSSPRTAVPAGSVALGGAYSAVYPRQSPGGWQLIGRTEAPMWDLDRDNPALVRPGDTVRFNAVRAQAVVAERPQATARPAPRDPAKAGLAVRNPGLQATVQDLGRPGYASLGVSSAGAMDRAALRRANRLAGNPEDAAGIELLLGGFELVALTDQVLAVAGASVPLEITPPPGDRDGDEDSTTPVRHPQCDAPFALLAGERLTVGTPTAGLRSYIGVRGGLGVPPALGSRSTDTMSGIGPEPLAAGSLLPVLPARPGSVVGHPEISPLPDADQTVLRVVPGPRQDWFSDETLNNFLSQDWTVTPQSNRIGLRLNGHSLSRSRDGELASEGTVRGAVQVPPEGQPVLFLSDHPVTGGYPVIAVVVQADLDKAAQLPPGAKVRFAVAPAAELPTAQKESLHA